MANTPVHRESRNAEEEVLHCDGKHRARFRMLFSGDRTATDSLTCGVATVGPNEPLPLHQHVHAEIYFGLAGRAHVTVDGAEFVLGRGDALFIPGDVPHAVHAHKEAKLFFAFAADSYGDVHYVYFDDDRPGSSWRRGRLLARNSPRGRQMTSRPLAAELRAASVIVSIKQPCEVRRMGTNECGP
ncbi:cupin domain-containing protein [Limimaricola cinnabarinus]|uniref:cupin domain-containing protein n=1 Tax=Limimaricola cinnabarinus TaxID=1125964 RepID=UPI002491241B|nr:cupin domain-containing protein [Limimaricola cinnabarinus]